MGKYALLLVSALIFSLLTYSYALKNALFQSNARTVQSYSINQAQNIAQSAAMLAVHYLTNPDASEFGGVDLKKKLEDLEVDASPINIPESVGEFESWSELDGKYHLMFYKATRIIDGNPIEILELKSTGKFEETEYIVSVVLEADNGTNAWDGALIDKAVHAENDIDMGNGVIDGDVSLNTRKNSMKLKGDITGDFFYYDTNESPGPSEDGVKGVDGETSNMPEKIKHNDPLFPTFPSAYITVENEAGKNYFYGNDLKNTKFNSFSTNSTTINIGDEDVTLYADNVDLSGDLTIVGDGTLSIMVENTIELGNGEINAGNGSEHLGIYYAGTEKIQYTGNGSFSGLLFVKNDNVDIQIGGNPTFTSHIIHIGNNGEIVLNGTPAVSSLIYAPKSSVELKGTGNSDFRGAIVSDTFSANGKASVIYDADFASTLPSQNQESDGDGSFTISYWN